MAGGEDEALDRAGADDRQVVRGAGAEAGDRADELHLGDVGEQAVGLAQQLVDAARGDDGVEAHSSSVAPTISRPSARGTR